MEAISEFDEQAITDFLSERREHIKQLQESKEIIASGLSARLLSISQSGNTYLLTDEAGYFQFQEFGRRAGKAPPFSKIRLWVERGKYGINVRPTTGEALRGLTEEKKKDNIAWGIINKIKREGSYAHRTNKPTGVLSEAINENEVTDLMEKIAGNRTREVLTDITRLFDA